MGFFNSFFEDENFFNIKDLYMNNFVPGKEIEKSLGLVAYTRKGIAGNVVDKINDIFREFLKKAKERGADAVINTRVTTGTYQQQGSGWNATYVVIYGEAVKLK